MSMDDLCEVCNYLPIGLDLGTAGQPSREQFGLVRAAGYELVINLAMPDSAGALPDEAELVTSHGMEYVPIPVVWEAPTAGDLECFFDVMDRARGRKVFVHCALNMRVSAFIFLYRVLRLGVSPDSARETMHLIWQPEGVWATFVADLLARHGLAPDSPAGAASGSAS